MSTPAKKINLHQRLHAVMRDMEPLSKTAKANGLKFDYISHDSVTEAVRPLLVEHGVSLLTSVEQLDQYGNRTTATVVMVFVNIDDPKDREVVRAGS